MHPDADEMLVIAEADADEEVRRRAPFLTIERAVIEDFGPEIGPAALAVYAVLCLHDFRGTGRVWPSVGTVAALLGCDRKTVMTALGTLQEVGRITRTPRVSNRSRRRQSPLTAADEAGGASRKPGRASDLITLRRDVHLLRRGGRAVREEDQVADGGGAPSVRDTDGAGPPGGRGRSGSRTGAVPERD